MNTAASTTSNRDVTGPLFNEINAETWRPVFWVFLGSSGVFSRWFSWTCDDIYLCPVFRGLLINPQASFPYKWQLLARRTDLPQRPRLTEVCDNMTNKRDLKGMLPEWVHHLVHHDRRGRESIDGVPWEIHAITNPKAHRAAVLEYLRDR